VKVPYALGFKIYRNSPALIQEFIGLLLRPIPRSVMLSSGFSTKLAFLLKSEKWKYEELVKFQKRALRSLVEHAYRNVPFYHEVFRKSGLNPSDIRTIDDLRKLSVLTKDDVRRNFHRLIAKNYRYFKPGMAFTSGSTGKPLEFYLDQATREWEYAAQWRQIFWGGVRNVNAKIATFRGDFVFEYGKTERVAKWHGLHKELIFNTYLLDPPHIRRMVEILNEFKPEVIRGYPHAVYMVARIISEEGLELSFRPRMIQTSSEFMPKHMRETIEAAFDSKIFDWYGQSEYVVSAGQCEHGTYHQTMETGIAVVIEDDWGFERLVGTSLWNYSMPFINYEVGDIVKIPTEPRSCECGRGLLIIDTIEGRVNDIILTPSGKAISGAAFDHYWKHRIIHKLSAIPEYTHFIQERLNKIIMEIYASKPLSDSDTYTILKELKLLLGEDLDIEVRYLDKIPAVKKWRFVESRVNRL